MFIQDKFFEQEEAKSKKGKGHDKVDPELEQMINNLKEQVADLNMFLEEERMNHRDTKRKAEEFLQDKVDEMRRDRKEVVRRLSDEHEQLMTSTLAQHQQEIAEQSESYDGVIARYKTEMAFLKGAFESFKSQSNAENQKTMRDLREELAKSYEETMQRQLQDLGKKLINEKHAAVAASTKEHNKTLANMEKQSSKELETLNRRFANHSADIRKLKESEDQKTELEVKYEDICRRNEGSEKELVNVKRDCADYKARLSVFEKNFSEKVEEVDSRYKAEMAELMEQNTELRKQYMKKCDQLFSVSATSETEKKEQTVTRKEAMKALIQSRSNAYVNIAASSKTKQSIPKERPCSAPSTRQEENIAIASAGKTDEVLARREVPFVRPQSVLELSAVFPLEELNGLTDEDLRNGLLPPAE